VNKLPEGFKTFAEFYKAVRRADLTGEVDPRLILTVGVPPPDPLHGEGTDVPLGRIKAKK
jgi:hypothetical protein